MARSPGCSGIGCVETDVLPDGGLNYHPLPPQLISGQENPGERKAGYARINSAPVLRAPSRFGIKIWTLRLEQPKNAQLQGGGIRSCRDGCSPGPIGTGISVQMVDVGLRLEDERQQVIRRCEPTTHRVVWRVILPTPHRVLEGRRVPTPAARELSVQPASSCNGRSRGALPSAGGFGRPSCTRLWPSDSCHCLALTVLTLFCEGAIAGLRPWPRATPSPAMSLGRGLGAGPGGKMTFGDSPRPSPSAPRVGREVRKLFTLI
jgi:hypothetical protein